ncbi:PREDICTED: membrane-spanning 4-domains subfamily A member 6A-like [Ceratotherium simum simum]|uniref:Membrane-spanning 4-domains subfamily A member 6A-like n=1 Tax=Ceratotherium simum simum TaxID=73337 RepID=A0ABM1DHL9_CERSS|nr:PREDICTED: membrane-spanning 4-domains subfamily A member 6A-like [Ceratotherium simum simum]
MLSYAVPGEDFVVLPPSAFLVPHVEERGPPNQDHRKKGLQSETKVLGTIQIVSGTMIMSLGIILVWASFLHHFSPIVLTLISSGYPFVGAKCFIISGSLCVILEKISNKRLAWISLVSSLLSLFITFTGLILLLVNLAEVLAVWGRCELAVASRQRSEDNYFSSRDVTSGCFFLASSLLGVLSIMLLFTLLELSIAIPSSILWWKQARSSTPGVVLFLAQSDTVVTSAPPKASADPDPHPGFDELAAS